MKRPLTQKVPSATPEKKTDPKIITVGPVSSVSGRELMDLLQPVDGILSDLGQCNQHVTEIVSDVQTGMVVAHGFVARLKHAGKKIYPFILTFVDVNIDGRVSSHKKMDFHYKMV